MFRWSGNKATSNEQASERDSRAARRTIRSLNLNPLSSDDEFEDANTSFNRSLNLDGDAGDSPEEMAAEQARLAAELAAEKAKPVQDSDFADDDEAWKKELKIKFDMHDVQYSFNAIESQMRKFGINRQWSKKDTLVSVLPEAVIEECKPILRLSEADAGPHIYKDLKEEILQLYGPREEDAFKKALALRLTGTPSALGKKLIHIWCPSAKPFVNCHCSKVVYGFWSAQLSAPILSGLANLKFNQDTYADIFKLADELWRRNGGTEAPSHAVVAAASAQDDSQSAAPQASAVRGGRGSFRGNNNRGNRGGRGSNRGGNRGGRGSYNNNSNRDQNDSSSSSNPKPHQKGPRNSPDVPDDACSRHWKDGKAATYCSDPLNCSWKNFIAPRKA